MKYILSSKKEMIFKKKPTNGCHASTVLPLDDGTVIAAWFGGTDEGESDVNIYTSVRNKQGEWSTPVMVTADLNTAHWNPVLFQKNDGSIILFFKVGTEIKLWQTYFSVSVDGKAWSEPKELVAGDNGNGRGPVKKKPVKLKNGTVLAGASDENSDIWRAFIDISEDDGVTWKRSDYIKGFDRDGKEIPMIQPTIWQDSLENVHFLARTKVGEIYRSDSSDNGKTWCNAYPTGLPNNHSGIDLDIDINGKIYLVYTPKSKPIRTPLVLALSEDNGKTFKTIKIFEFMPGEFSYPAIKIKNNKAYITYTYNREYIAYREILIND